MGTHPQIGSPALLYVDDAIPANVFISVLLAQQSLKHVASPLPPHFEVLLILN